MNKTLLPDYCDVEGCMVNSMDNFPILCSNCIALTLDNIKELPEDTKGELFFAYKSAIASGEYNDIMNSCLDDGDLTKEEYEDIENEIWNDILLGDQ